MVGLKKEEKTRLHQLEWALVSLEIRVASTESSKAWNVQLIKIIEDSISGEKIAESTQLEKKTTEKKAQEEKIAKAELPEEEKTGKERTAEEKKTEETMEKVTPPEEEEAEEKVTFAEEQPEEVSIEGVVSIDKNNYYISDPESGMQYKLVDLNKEEMKSLKKMKGKTVNLEKRLFPLNLKTPLMHNWFASYKIKTNSLDENTLRSVLREELQCVD